MKADVDQYKPFEKFFIVTVLDTVDSLDKAHTLEQKFIKEHNTLGPSGYNVLNAHPAMCKKYYYLKRRNII